MGFVNWVENSAVGIWMIDSLWAYPIILSAHAVGMAIVVGTVVMIDLRVLGYAGDAPIDSFKSMFAVTYAGVVINFLSGVALFTSDPEKFVYHPVFWAKISMMIMGVSLVYLVWRQVKTDVNNSQGVIDPSPKTKMLAWISILLWFGVIVAGRLIAYVELG